MIDVQRDPDAAAVAVLARLREGLQEARADPLARHLDQAQRGHLGDLVLGAVTTEALHESTQDEVPIALQNHVDEVDDDDAADVAQAKLPNDLLGGLEVVAGDRLLEVSTLTGELAGVDVDHGHRLGPVDHQRAAGRQVDLAVQRLHQLLLDAVLREDVLRLDPVTQSIGKIRCDGADVLAQRGPCGVTGHDQACDVLVEDVANDLDRQIRLAVEERGRTG